MLVPLLALVGGLFWWQVQPPTVTVRPDGLEVDSLFYGESFPASEITGDLAGADGSPASS